MITLKESDEYTPGEPYEFWAPLSDKWGNGAQRRYRCFRGSCNGAQVQTADRNSHNQYHNLRES